MSYSFSFFSGDKILFVLVIVESCCGLCVRILPQGHSQANLAIFFI